MTKVPVESILNTEEGIAKVFQESKYFPMHLLLNDDTDLHFILGVRGDGKTHNSKKQILEDWFDRKIKSYWIVSERQELDDMNKFKDFHLDLIIDDAVDDPDINDNDLKDMGFSEQDIRCHHLVMDSKMEWKDGMLIDENGDWFLKVIPLKAYAKYKKGKHPRVHAMYYDEFMKEKYIKNEWFAIMDLLTSVQREKKKFKFTFMGNAISLNHPLLGKLDVFELDKNKDGEDQVITVIYGKDGKTKLGKVWSWKRPFEDAVRKNGGLLWFEMGEKTEYNDYAVKNDFKNDNYSHVVKLETNEYFEYIHTFKALDTFVDFYRVPAEFNNTNKDLFYCKLNKNPDENQVKYALIRDHAGDDVVYTPRITRGISKRIMNNLMWYESVTVKQNIWETVKNTF